jgi:ABC-type sulfate transport system permease subunit
LEAEHRKKELQVVLTLPLLVMEAPFLKAPFLLRLLLVLEARQCLLVE